MTGTKQVLIIDDCEEDREVYRRYLRFGPNLTFEIYSAESAEDALLLCQHQSFDVVLLDYELPDLTGLDLLSKWRANGIQESTAIIMLTAFGDEAVAVQALKQGAQDYLVKQSVTAESLNHSIRTALEQLRLKKALQQSQNQQRLIATTALRIRDSLELPKILDTTTAEIHKLLKCDRVLVYQFGANSSPKVVSEVVSPPFPSALTADLHAIALMLPTFPIHAKSDPLCMPHLEHSVLEDPQKDALAALDVKALIEVPIQIECRNQHQCQLWGMLAIHQCHAPRDWQAGEVDLLQALCTQLAIAIQQSELLTQTQCALVKEQELSTFKSHIVATVSHEYRTPITAILGSASTLEKHYDSLGTQRNQKLLHMISQQARHLRHLVDDMLVANQVELGQIQFKPFPLNLEQFFLSLIEEYQVTTQKSHKLILDMADDCEGFWGDVGLLRQIFVNVLSNAIKYSPNGGKIIISIQGNDESVTFRFIDQGIGIPADELPLVFQSFKRASNVDTITGTGLGLAIAQSCVELHKGRISISSQLNEFTEVSIWLPKRLP